MHILHPKKYSATDTATIILIPEDGISPPSYVNVLMAVICSTVGVFFSRLTVQDRFLNYLCMHEKIYKYIGYLTIFNKKNIKQKPCRSVINKYIEYRGQQCHILNRHNGVQRRSEVAVFGCLLHRRRRDTMETYVAR
jgi:hypothetical protein